jgi:hypothetical protein
LIVFSPFKKLPGRCYQGSIVETFSSNALENLYRAGYFDQHAPDESGLSAAQKAALDVVRATPGLTTGEVARKVGRPQTTVKHTLGRLEAMELIQSADTPQRWYFVAFVDVAKGGDAHEDAPVE